MKRMTPENLENIRRRFETGTGVDLTRREKRPFHSGKILILAAAVVACLAMAAFGWPLFSSLDGDELSLLGTYEGNGIVTIQVENRSDKRLKFQKNTRLMRWVSAEEVLPLNGKVCFENTEFLPHSTGTMTLDLSRAYDMDALESGAPEWYYLILTNHDFLFGQDWMCSVNFGTGATVEQPAEKAVLSVSAEPDIRKNILPELQFYFEESYTGNLMAFNEANFQYQQKTAEVLARFPGEVVPALGPVLMVGGPSEFLDPEPVLGNLPEGTLFDDAVEEAQQNLLTFSQWTYTDGYGRMIATAAEKSWSQTVLLPRHQGEHDGGVAMPVCFLFVYDTARAVPGNHAFLYGGIYSFEELEAYKVLEDEHYAIYNATDLIYTDVDVYLDHFLTVHSDIYCDAQIRQRVHAVYDFYRNPENIRQMYGYLEFPDPT